MYKITIIFFFIVQILSGQANYSIQQNVIIVSLSTKLDSNNAILKNILSDSLAKKCTQLVVGGKASNIPDELYNLVWIEELEISLKKPISLSKKMSQLVNLINLRINVGVLKVDTSLYLPKLENISILYSGLKEFPKAICKWKELTQIDIQKGTFTSIPKEIINLKNLKIINISDNKIKQLPIEIGTLINLEVLSMESNCLISIPNSICQLKNLRELYILKNPRLKIKEEQIICIKALPRFENIFE